MISSSAMQAAPVPSSWWPT